MADDKDLRQDDDAEGHMVWRTPEEGKRDAPEEAAEKPEEDDVAGHSAARSPEPAKKDAPGAAI
jgi:hypothetical protein